MSQLVKPVIISAKCGKKPAIFSVIAPVIALGLYMLSATVALSGQMQLPVFVEIGMILVWAGLLSGIVGFFYGLRGHNINTVLPALTGLLLNSCVLISAFGVELPFFGGVAGRSNGNALLKLNAIPQVFENSVTVIDPKLGFRFELSAGFTKNPNPASSSRTIQSYVRFADNGSPNISVNIDRLRGIMPPKKDKPSVDEREIVKEEIRKSSPYAVLAKVEQGQWKSHTLDVFLFEMPENGDMISSWCAKVPLADEAIMIKVSGLKGDEGQYRKVLTHILKSLQISSDED
jgi:hypothetical protein